MSRAKFPDIIQGPLNNRTFEFGPYLLRLCGHCAFYKKYSDFYTNSTICKMCIKNRHLRYRFGRYRTPEYTEGRKLPHIHYFKGINAITVQRLRSKGFKIKDITNEIIETEKLIYKIKTYKS